MRLIFMGTSQFAVPALKKLYESHHNVCQIFTQPDRPSGRGHRVSISPVKSVALDLGLPIHQPQSLKLKKWIGVIQAVQAEVLVVIAYGKILPSFIFDLPPLGTINVHASLLPRYRGAAPIPWAIVNGETQTGVSTMKIDENMDTGPIFLQEEVSIPLSETATELQDRLAILGADLLLKTLDLLKSNLVKAKPQNFILASYAPMLKKLDGKLDWNQSSRQIYDRIRGFNPWPGTYTHYRGTLLKILEGYPVDPPWKESSAGSLWNYGTAGALVSCGEGCLRLKRVQLENHRVVKAKDFLNGIHLPLNQFVGLGS